MDWSIQSNKDTGTNDIPSKTYKAQRDVHVSRLKEYIHDPHGAFLGCFVKTMKNS
jgi:hypothetical protein